MEFNSSRLRDSELLELNNDKSKFGTPSVQTSYLPELPNYRTRLPGTKPVRSWIPVLTHLASVGFESSTPPRTTGLAADVARVRDLPVDAHRVRLAGSKEPDAAESPATDDSVSHVASRGPLLARADRKLPGPVHGRYFGDVEARLRVGGARVVRVLDAKRSTP